MALSRTDVHRHWNHYYEIKLVKGSQMTYDPGSDLGNKISHCNTGYCETHKHIWAACPPLWGLCPPPLPLPDSPPVSANTLWSCQSKFHI